MRTGRVLKKSVLEPHLDKDKWLEVWPDGSNRELAMIDRLAKRDRTYRDEAAESGQSPVLVRQSAWDAMVSKII